MVLSRLPYQNMMAGPVRGFSLTFCAVAYEASWENCLELLVCFLACIVRPRLPNVTSLPQNRNNRHRKILIGWEQLRCNFLLKNPFQ